MAVRVPIIVDYNGKGIQRLKREFGQLEGAAAKTKFALQKSLVPATATLAGLAAVGTDAVQAAIEDQKAQQALARTIRQTTKATDAQIAANEEWISTQGELFGVTDDELRPALAKLVRVTKDVGKAQMVARLAMDVAAGTGKDLNDVTDAFTKALGGNMKSLRALAPEVAALIKRGASAEEVFAALNTTFGGQAAEQANTAAGRFERLKIRLDELKESLGARLLPILENKVLPALEKFAAWAEKNPRLILAVAAAIGVLAAGIIALNIAMWANPYLLVIAGLVGMIVYLQKALDIATKLKQVWDSFTTAPWNKRGTSGVLADLQADVRMGEVSRIVPQNYAGRDTRERPNVNVTVSGGDPKAVVDAIVRWSRQNGRLPPQVRTAG
jgi:hypothetical protein